MSVLHVYILWGEFTQQQVQREWQIKCPIQTPTGSWEYEEDALKER